MPTVGPMIGSATRMVTASMHTRLCRESFFCSILPLPYPEIRLVFQLAVVHHVGDFELAAHLGFVDFHVDAHFTAVSVEKRLAFERARENEFRSQTVWARRNVPR